MNFFSDFGMNSILFQRGIYPAETFKSVQQYGLTILMSTDDKIESFIKNVLAQTTGMFFFIFHGLSKSVSIILDSFHEDFAYFVASSISIFQNGWPKTKSKKSP
jgi:hypothetical protein